MLIPSVLGRATCLLALTLAAACARHRRVADAPGGDRCSPVEERITASAPWDSLPGNWRLTLVATAGPATGRSVEGNLTLRAQDPAVQQVDRPGPAAITVPVIGTTEIGLELVGAQRIGDVGSVDPERPGVAVWVSQDQDGASSAVLRIGEEAIRSNLIRFDGAYTVLHLHEVSANSMRGAWASGVTSEAASGYFCAERLAADR